MATISARHNGTSSSSGIHHQSTNSHNSNTITLYEFLMEAELVQYYDELKNNLKINTVAQLKYVEEDDLSQLGMSKPEQRRLRKYFEKYFPQTYLKKIKKMILPKNKEETDSNVNLFLENAINDQQQKPIRVPSKHIISADSIQINKELGVGEFGVVQQGIWTNEDGERVQVAIKCLNKQRMQNNSMEFLKEAAIMHSIDNEHIVRLYGVVLDTNSLMLVTELAPLRSLLECLKEPALRPSFPILSLCEFAYQICDGMHYLESKRLIHRDLAARNILVFSKNKVKISDFGLSRALGVGKDYYQTNFNVNLKLPIAWCAPECINYLRFTSASDVWAYGVTLWEMFSYGFQPWAALTGQQILEAIDEPSCQRLEQPECCPKEYYTIMLKCWEHDPANRPKFGDILSWLPDCKPELVQIIKDNNDSQSSTSSPSKQKKDYLLYKVGDIITVLDKKPLVTNATSTTSVLSSSPGSLTSFSSTQSSEGITLWKGALNNGKTGLFNPSNSVAYLGQNLPTATNNSNTSNITSHSSIVNVINNHASLSTSFIRGILESKSSHSGNNNVYASRRKIKPEMISRPQNDLKHTGHVGADGAFFGDVSFLGEKYHQLPKQIVTPYKPQDDKSKHDSLSRTSSDLSDKVPLLTKGSTSSIEGKSGPASENYDSIRNGSRNMKNGHKLANISTNHEYHEIGDDNGLDSPQFETFDFGPSLMDEVFKELEIIKPDFINDISEQQKAINDSNVNVKNEIKEIATKLALNNKDANTNKKKQATVKPISAADQQTLDSAIAMAKELATRSMLELDGRSSDLTPILSECNLNNHSTESPKTPSSPNKKKFSFKFKNSPKPERKNFSEATENIADIQSLITEEAKEAYNKLIQKGEGLERSKSDVQEKRAQSNLATNLVHLNSANLSSSLEPSDNESDNQTDSNPLRLLRSGLTVVPKIRGNKQRLAATPQTASLARLTANVNRSALGTPPPVPNNNSMNSNCNSTINNTNSTNNGVGNNFLPLPPRDRSKPLPVLKHHERKHPLVIPNFFPDNENTQEITINSNDQQINHHRNEPMMSTFKPHQPPVLKQVSCPQPPVNYVNSSIYQNEISTRKSIVPVPPPKPARSFFEESSDGEESKQNGSQQVKNDIDKKDVKSSDNRGIDADEVRVVQKVLANEVDLTLEECYEMVQTTNWNVHQAVKCIRLRETLKLHSINLNCNWAEMLSKFNWNTRQALNYLIATQGLPEDTTEV